MSSKKIECISRLIELNNAYSEICEWLIEQKIITLSEVQIRTRKQEQAEFVFFSLKEACDKDMLMLLDFEWSILPQELIKITCITYREKKEFTYGY